jgi:3-oxoacyl-[acyl-carrier protein] reductase
LTAAQDLVSQLHQQGLQASPVCFDVTDAQAAKTALETLLAQGPIQILVNNAGIHDDAVFPGMSAQQRHKVIDVSLHGFFNVTQPLSLPMIRSRFGRIVSVSSVAAIAGNRGQVNYAAAKAALHGASKSLAQELASRGITVNVVAPGIIESPMIASAFPKEKIEQLVPMKRSGQPQEVADLIAFLASDQAAYITGQVISINGGMI